MAKGFAAIVLGHVIGCAMLFLAGLIGGRTGCGALSRRALRALRGGGRLPQHGDLPGVSRQLVGGLQAEG